MMISKRPKIMISFQEGGENGGPYISHRRICEGLQDAYDFQPLLIPRGRIGLFNPVLQRNLAGQIRAGNPDIIHIHGLQLAGYQLMRAAKKAGKPVVLAVHGSTGEAAHFPKWKRMLVAACERYTLRQADLTYCVSNYVRNWPLVQRNARHLYGTIYNLPHQPDPLQSGDIRRELGIAASDLVIASTGRITAEKGFDTLCDAILQWQPPKNIKFVIAGDGEYLAAFRQRIAERELVDQVFLLGYRQDIPAILKGSDIFVICSRHETLCISILEAYQERLPVVATQVGGIPEIVTDGSGGYLVETDNPRAVWQRLAQLSQDSLLRQNMGEYGYQKLQEQFTAEVILGQIRDVYGAIGCE